MWRELVTDEIYHVYNRGVDKRTVFMDDKDHFRALHDLYEFNDSDLTFNGNYSFAREADGERVIMPITRARKLLVEIMAFCLMPNHYHLVLRQLVDNGISLFMRKFGVGYTNYFNVRYRRSGALFQGRFKAVHVSEEAHMLHLPHYIHLNPLDLSFPAWRSGGLHKGDVPKALAALENYRWSSYPSYIGEHSYRSLTKRDYVLDLFGGERGYAKSIEDWLTAETSFEALSEVMLD